MIYRTTSEKDKNDPRRSWILQLYKEHEKICWEYGVRLTVPIIEIGNASSSWGSWYPPAGTLKISARLIQHYSWDVVLNILKHEMAHQVVTELFHSREAHGAQFEEACDMLGVPHDFRGASGDVPRIILDINEKASKAPQRNLLVKIEKLLALAESCNEHEALLAMGKANFLIAKYNIRRIEQSLQDSYDCIVINHKTKRIEGWQRKVCAILINHFFVKIILSELFDAERCCTHKTIEILGTTENVLIANYVYSFLMTQTNSLWLQFQRKHQAAGRRKRSYCLGVLDGFARKLASSRTGVFEVMEHVSAAPAHLSVLVCDRDQGLVSFIEQRYPRLSRKKFAAARVFLKEYEAGCSDGGSLTLNKGLTRKEGFQGKMLPQGS